MIARVQSPQEAKEIARHRPGRSTPPRCRSARRGARCLPATAACRCGSRPRPRRQRGAVAVQVVARRGGEPQQQAVAVIDDRLEANACSEGSGRDWAALPGSFRPPPSLRASGLNSGAPPAGAGRSTSTGAGQPGPRRCASAGDSTPRHRHSPGSAPPASPSRRRGRRYRGRVALTPRW